LIELGHRSFGRLHHDIGRAEINVGAGNRLAAAERRNVESSGARIQLAQGIGQEFMPPRKRDVAGARERIPRKGLRIADAAGVPLEAQGSAKLRRQLSAEGEHQLARLATHIDIDVLQGQLRQRLVPVFHGQHCVPNDQPARRQVAQAQRPHRGVLAAQFDFRGD
jgi:hypothetical protein